MFSNSKIWNYSDGETKDILIKYIFLFVKENHIAICKNDNHRLLSPHVLSLKLSIYLRQYLSNAL